MNNDGELDASDVLTTSDTNGDFSFSGLLPGGYTVRLVQQAGYQQTAPTATNTSTADDASQSVSVQGSDAPVEVDCACGGTWTIQGGIDLGVQSVVDAADLTSLMLGRGLTTGEFASLLRSSGDLVVDGAQNNDNVRNTGLSFPRLDMERLLSAVLAYNGQPATLPTVTGTGSDGTDPVQSAAVAPGFYSVSVSEGQTAADRDFGEFHLGSIAGTVFADTDRDGAQGSSESPIAGATVFVDTNGDGSVTAGELTTTTDGVGHYSFGDLGPGNYPVRISLDVGYAATTNNPTSVSATSGFGAIVDFGEAPLGPTLFASGPALATINQQYTVLLSANDPGHTISEWFIDWGDGTLQGVTGNPSSATHIYQVGGLTYTIAAAAQDDTGLYDATPFTVTVAPPLQVLSVTPNADGVAVRFNDVIDAASVHLYDALTAGHSTLLVPDVTLVGQHVGAVAGSLVFDADLEGLTFIATGGTLVADQYTLTLLSGASGFTDTVGALDGKQAGVPDSGNYSTTFTIDPSSAAVLSMPDFIRGPTQPVDYAVGGIGLPLTLSNASGIRGLTFHIDYDPALLTITGAITTGAPAGATLVTNVSTPGRATIKRGRGSVTTGQRPEARIGVAPGVPDLSTIFCSGMPLPLQHKSDDIGQGECLACRRIGRLLRLVGSSQFVSLCLDWLLEDQTGKPNTLLQFGDDWSGLRDRAMFVGLSCADLEH